jgi:predicted GNAT family N-acyltransferase
LKNHLINKVIFRSPLGDKQFEEYDLFRWKVLRKPIGKTIETLKDKFDKDSFHIIGLYNKVIVASGRVHFNNNDEAQIRYMAVDNAFRAKGIGKEVLKILEEYIKKNNAKKIILNARNDVIEFYKKSNYLAVEEYLGSDTGIPHTKMEKKII